ncbi:hypothetical protein IQ268_16900 [Oculatella sp. LEGE 06141]|uniref:hypothetical protein n=1 Tax=Oculatella sp. LEGE 06141 TaxID=1828648 RepID=UPI00187F8896|nr:hypothetical protein [Oculatella sp. LEGE 06141]MBE9180244.1 hypothetical protein [Oculatella sp. LEGE 06141]
MNERNSETGRPDSTTESIDHQPKFNPEIDDERLRRVWANLEQIEAGLKQIAEGIQIADEYNRRTQKHLAELE